MRLRTVITVLMLAASIPFVCYGQSGVGTSPQKAESVKNTKGNTRALTNNTGRVNSVLIEGMDSNAEVFYSDAPMFVGEQTVSGGTTLFIQGTAKFANGAEIRQDGVMSLTGDFLSVKDKADGTVRPLFAKDASGNDLSVGTVRFIGQWNKQKIGRASATSPATAVPSSTKLENANYVLNFPIIQVAKENLNKLTDIPTNTVAGKGTYKIEEMGLLSVATNVAISVKELDVTNGNRFSIDVKSAGLDADAVGPTVDNYYVLNSGYADIRGITTENNASGKDASGHHEVNMKLYNYNAGTDFVLNGNPYGDTDLKKTNAHEFANGYIATFMRGFTSPFDKLRSDYMFYHVLTKPGFGSVTSWEAPLADPRTLIQPGRGYFYAMDLSNQKFDEIGNNWNIQTHADKRARGGYNFSRLEHEYNDLQNKSNPTASGVYGLNLYTVDSDKKTTPSNKYEVLYEAQRFNTGDITVDLLTNTNMLANPYMTPISLTALLAKDPSVVAPGTGTTDATTAFVPGSVGTAGASGLRAIHELAGTGQQAVDAAKAGKYALLRAGYWVINSAFVMNVTSNGKPAYAYNVKYDYVTKGTLTPPTIDRMTERYIEPMQMFVVQAATPGKFVFSSDMKTFTGIPFETKITTTPNLPDGVTKSSTAASAVDIPDWLIVETAAEGASVTADRTAIKFYQTASLAYDDHDMLKALIVADPSTDEVVTAKMTRVSDDAKNEMAPANVVYTKSSDGRALLSNGVGYDTKEIPLHYIPSGKEESVNMTIHGIETIDLSKIEGVWLIDKENNNYKQDLLSNNSYTFVSKPTENALNAENRFVLRFYDDGAGENPSVTEKPIACYYSGSTLYVGNLNENDLGSNVRIFDLQGRLMGSTTVNNYPSVEYQKSLGQGTFIVRITGNRNHTTKFVNIQNN